MGQDVTKKPVVSVGRFTSPDTMVSQIRHGVLDLIGAARPRSPIRSCRRRSKKAGTMTFANASAATSAYSGDMTVTPIRCTQNPTMGEEWRKAGIRNASRRNDQSEDPRGRCRPRRSRSGSCARPARLRSAPRGSEPRARRPRHARVPLPGLGQWARVRDWRVGQIEKMANVDVFRDNAIDEDQILEFAPDRVVIATGARWRRDGIGRWHSSAIPESDSPSILTPDDIMAGAIPNGPVVVFDDDHYYIGGVIAEALRSAGLEVTLVTPANEVSTWTTHTEEQHRIQARILRLGIAVETGTTLTSVNEGSVTLESVHTGAARELEAVTVVMVTSREPWTLSTRR